MSTVVAFGTVLFFAFLANEAVAFARPGGCTGVAGRLQRLSSMPNSIAGLAIVLQLQSGLELQSLITPPTSLTLAAAETRQGLYREYTVEKVDDSALKDLRRNYKTAEETDTSKNKYWTILAVLLAGSFAIPMVQYFWYVAEED